MPPKARSCPSVRRKRKSVAERPPVSLSMAGHCRMALYLDSHGYQKEEPTPQAYRTFGFGHLAEKAMFDGFPAGSVTEEAIGPWFFQEAQLRDNASGITMNPSEWTVTDRQREVELHGYKGHIDALLRHKGDGVVLLPDMKTASSFGYDKSLTSDLLDNPFSRQYVFQLHAYRAGLLAQGETIHGMILLYLNKEQSRLSFRNITHQPWIDEEIAERLSWAKANAEPTPDWPWTPREALPLLCSYCNQRTNCAAIRGMSLTQEFNKRNGNPIWKAA